MKASVVKRGRAAESKVLSVMQMFRRDVGAAVNEGMVGVIVDNKVQVGMWHVRVLRRVGKWMEGMSKGAAVREWAIIHREVVNRQYRNSVWDGGGEGRGMNVDVVHVLVMGVGIGEDGGEDGGVVVKDVATAEESDGSGGHVVYGEVEEEKGGEDGGKWRMNAVIIRADRH